MAPLVCDRDGEDLCPYPLLVIAEARILNSPLCEFQPSRTQVHAKIKGASSRGLQNYILEISHHTNSLLVAFEKLTPMPTVQEQQQGPQDKVTWDGLTSTAQVNELVFVAEVKKPAIFTIGVASITVELSHQQSGQNPCTHRVALDLSVP